MRMGGTVICSCGKRLSVWTCRKRAPYWTTAHDAERTATLLAATMQRHADAANRRESESTSPRLGADRKHLGGEC